MVRTIIDANDIAHPAREQRKKLAMHLLFRKRVVKHNRSGPPPMLLITFTINDTRKDETIV
jgi:hypothetical protein